MKAFLFVFLGSGIGGALRYGISLAFVSVYPLKFPLPTFIANIIAAFLVGLFYALAIEKSWVDRGYILLLTTGLCGGLSTFSAFSYETMKLWQGHQYLMSVVYVGLSVIACLVFTFIGSKVIQ